MKKKVCVVTAARSEYGVLRWLIDSINKNRQLTLQILVTGSHLSKEHGYTFKEIEADNYVINEKVEMLTSTDTQCDIIKSMGLCSINIADSFERLKPDLIVVLGDRYELLPICSAALLQQIPIAHISGGDITEGAIDDQIRNAVTMMSSLHFPGVKDSAERIQRMIGKEETVFVVGEPGLDNFKRLDLLSRKDLSVSLDVDVTKKWILVTYHPETKRSLEENLCVATQIVKTLENLDNIEVVITKANADFGGSQINDLFFSAVKNNPSKFKLYSSLGQLRYLSFMKEVACVIGNSSSGIIEAPCLGKPVLNIGDRQKGRYLCENVLSVSSQCQLIDTAIVDIVTNDQKYAFDYYYGDGNTSERIVEDILNYLKNSIC